MIENYDPNIRFGTHTWEFTFQMWGYILEMQYDMGGNCRGLSTIETAIDSLANKLYEDQGEYPEIVLAKFNKETQMEDTLQVTLGEENMDIEDELKDMLVKVELINFKEEKKGI